jgi:hypothetical protein
MYSGSSQIYALLLLPVALIFIVYPLMIYIWRNGQIRGREASRWDDPWGPVMITILLIFALCIQFGLKVSAWIFGKPRKQMASQFKHKLCCVQVTAYVLGG